MIRYLADSSIWAWADKKDRPDIRRKLATRYEAGEIVTCVPVVLESMHRPETPAQYEERFQAFFEPLDRVPLEDAAVERALEVQRQLAIRPHGNHRRPAVDFLIASAAEAAGEGIVLWFFDRDLQVICEHTGQPFEAEESTGPGH